MRDVRALDFGDARAPSLNVGCGPLYQVQEEGCRGMWDPGEWVHLDADPRALPNADREYVAWQSKCPDGSTVTTRTLRHDITMGLSMIANASLASIFAEHVAEHLPPETVPRVLAEFWRVLRPGGTLRLSTPDLRKFAAAYLGRSDTELDFVARAHRWAPRHPSWEAPEYSGAAIVNDLFRNHGHDVGFIWDAPSLTRAMVRAGIPSDAIAEDAYQSGKPLSEFDSPLRRAESFYLAATKPLTPGDDRALAEPADPEAFADAGADAFELAVGAAFKWDRGAPQWAAAFLASNDALPHYDGVCATIGALAALPGVGVELATVVGGLGFLPLLECADNWRRVTLVDGNVNEFGKVLAFRRGLRTRRTRAAYAAAPVDRELEAALAADPAAFYLPGALARGGVRLERASPHRRFAFAYDGREAPLTSLLPPSAYPELAWRARTDPGYRNVRRALIQALHRTLYLRPPAAGELDAAGRACVVFASMPDTEGLERALAAATRDCAVVLPVRACGKGTGSWCDGAAPHNLALLDPHPLWRVAARAAVGRAATVLHYWSPEDRLALGGPHDADWEVNAAADGAPTPHPDPESPCAASMRRCCTCYSASARPATTAIARDSSPGSSRTSRRCARGSSASSCRNSSRARSRRRTPPAPACRRPTTSPTSSSPHSPASSVQRRATRPAAAPRAGASSSRSRGEEYATNYKAKPGTTNNSASAPQRLSARRTGCDRPRAQTTGETGARSSPRRRRPAKGRPICLASSSPRMRGRARTATASNACRRRRGCRPA